MYRDKLRTGIIRLLVAWREFYDFQEMNCLIELVRASTSAKVLHVHLRFADEIVCAVRPDLWDFISRRCPKNDVEDVLQEVLIAIAKGLGECKCRTDRQFWAWCYKIARNKSCNFYRRRDARIPSSPTVEEIEQLINVAAQWDPLSAGERLDVEAIMKVLSEKEPECRAFLWSHYVLGLDFQDIAEEQSMTYDSVRVRISRCRKSAKKLLTTLEKGKK